MTRDMWTYCRSCQICQREKMKNNNYSRLKTGQQKYPCDKIALDIASSLQTLIRVTNIF